MKEKATASFALRFKVHGDATSAVRVLFAGADGDEGSFLELGPAGVSWGYCQEGEEYDRVTVARRPLTDLAGATLVFERRPNRWGLSADGVLIAKGEDPPETGRRIGFAVKDGRAQIGDLRFQDVAEVFFTDGFMRTTDDPTSWTEAAGTWRLNAIQNPLLSANAFNYAGAGEDGATAITGEWFWSDLDFSIACRPAKESVVGMYLCYRGPQDYYLLRWHDRKSQTPLRELVRRVGNTETVVASSPGGFEAGQWYSLRAQTGAGWAQFYVSDHLVLTARDPGLTFGKVGLFTQGLDETVFDDVRVESRPAELVDFEQYRLGGWLRSGGEWVQLLPAPEDRDVWPGGVLVSAEAPAGLLWGQPSWENYTVRARISPWEKGTLGLCFRYQDARNFYTARWKKASAPRIEIWKTEEGRESLLAAETVPDDLIPHELSVSSEEDRIVVSVDRKPVVSAADESFVRGRVGLYAASVRGGGFSDVLYTFLPAKAPLKKHKAAFSAERGSLMILWSDPMSDWAAGSHPREGASPVKVWWHRCDFHGDARVDLRLREPLSVGAEVGLALNGGGADLKKGYVARIRRPPAEGGGAASCVLELLGNDQVLGSAPLAWETGPRTLSLRRAGNAIGLHVDDRPALVCPLDREVTGRRLGFYAVNAEAPVEDVDIYSDNVLIYTFDEAPTDWRFGGGIWEVTNKWQCDPRWSFFTGRYSLDTKAAVLWNRRPLYGDFTVEYYIGNKMERERGNQYEYARDMNVTVCADGKDLSSGYSAVFGGFMNTVSGIFRGAERWAMPSDAEMRLINQKGLHRKWYHFTISRKGDRLEMRVAEAEGSTDDTVLCSRVDDAPLQGNRWGLWTYDNGITIGRVRVSAERIGALESPDEDWPAVAKTLYEK